MDRTMKYNGYCTDGRPPAEVPIGWQRRIHQHTVIYISPSGSVLTCLEQAKSYLLTDGTCKCGLECPLILHKVFNFDPGAAVRQRTPDDAQADSAVTKLCIHKRKIIAVAALHKSMETQISSIATGACHGGSLNHQATSNHLHNGPSSSDAHEKKTSYRIPMSCPQHYQHEPGSPPRMDAYTVQARVKLSAGDRKVQRSPYRSGLLSPPFPPFCSSQHYADGILSPRPNPLRSPEAPALHFHGALSPGSRHVNGERFTPLSPHSVMVNGLPSDTQLSCAMAGRTNISSLSSINAKSPNREPKSPCSFPQFTDHQHKTPSQQHSSIPQLPRYVVHKKQTTSSEKDPLGILDPIPGKGDIRDQVGSTPSSLQFSIQPQVPPAIVPLPSNLPLPVAKSGIVSHGHCVRVQRPSPLPVSSSPVTSPVHMAGPAPIRVEETHHPLTSVSSQYRNCALIMGPQGAKLPFQSQQEAVQSPETLILHRLKEATKKRPVGVNVSRSSHLDSTGLPAHGSDGVGHSEHSLRAPSHQQLDRQDPSTFPASGLLSAAAKSKLVRQNKGGSRTRVDSSGHHGLVGGGRQIYSEEYGICEPKYPPSSGLSLSDGQSGRAALRDKLMAQQREVHRKRKTPIDAGGDMSFPMNMQHCSGLPGYSEPMKRLLQQGGLPNNTSMAQLLQSMSHQGTQNGLNHLRPPPASSGKSLFFEESMPHMSNLQSAHGPHDLPRRAAIPSYRSLGKEYHQDQGEALNTNHFAHRVNQMHHPAFDGNLDALGYGRHEDIESICNPNRQQQQFSHHVKQSSGNFIFKDRTGLPPVMSNGGFDTYPESGKASSLNSTLRHSHDGGQRWRRRRQKAEAPLQAGHFLLSPDGPPGQPSGLNAPSPDPPMDNLRNFEASVTEMMLRSPKTATSQPPQDLASQRAKAALIRETMQSVITRNGVTTFSASPAACPSLGLSRSVIRSPPPRHSAEDPAQHPQPREVWPRRKPPQANGVSTGVSAGVTRVSGRFRRGVQRRPKVAREGAERGSWRIGELLQGRAQDFNMNGFYAELLRRRACLEPPQFNGTDYSNGFFGNMNGEGPTIGSVNPMMVHSPERSTGSEAGVTDISRAYRLYNGHLNGRLGGNSNCRDKGGPNGGFAPNIADGREQSLGSADLYVSSQPLAHWSGSQPIGEAPWGQAPWFQPLPSRPKEDGQAFLCGISQSAQSQVEPGSSHRTRKDDLDTLLKANRIPQSGGEVTNYIEAAIQDAMSQWNKLSANRAGQVKPPKPKRRKIAR